MSLMKNRFKKGDKVSNQKDKGFFFHLFHLSTDSNQLSRIVRCWHNSVRQRTVPLLLLYNFLEYGINRALFNKYKFLLLIEFAVLFAAFPLSVILGIASVETRWLMWTITAIYLLTILLARKPDSAALGLSSLNSRKLWALMIVALAILTALYLSFVFLRLNRQLLVRLIFILLLYPLVSVPAQEFFFRSFFFFRYGQVFEPRLLIAVNTLSFALYHMIFGNWAASLASLAAGVVLAILYHKFRNFFLNCLLHATFGILVFLMGWAGHFTTLRAFAN